MTNKNSHFLPTEKILKAAKRKMEPDAVKGVQSFAEKMVQDIITRSTLLCNHSESDVIDAAEICNVIEKNFDHTFGIRSIIAHKNRPKDSHTEKMAEISRQK
ncbi:hypothetical protein NUSPORA_00280 [Nucleospora cyclopteri]